MSTMTKRMVRTPREKRGTDLRKLIVNRERAKNWILVTEVSSPESQFKVILNASSKCIIKQQRVKGFAMCISDTMEQYIKRARADLKNATFSNYEDVFSK